MNNHWRKTKGLTISEIMLAVCLLIVVISAILLAYTNCFVLIDSIKNTNIATNAAQSLIEKIRCSPYSLLTNYQVQIDDTIYDLNLVSGNLYSLNFTVSNLPSNQGVIYVDYDYDHDGTENPEFLEVTVSICWRQGSRVIGEDSNLNGVLDAGEDKNGNNKIDSPVEFTTRIVNRS